MRALTERILRLSSARIMFALCLSLLSATGMYAQCSAAHYRIGESFINPKGGNGALYISVRSGDYSLAKLACLSQTLKERNPGWREITVFIFTSPEAAKYFVMPGVADNPGLWYKELHVSYDLDVNKHEEGLTIMPFGFRTPNSYVTSIELPLRGAPPCKLEISGRCALVLENIKYPGDALKAKASGTVVLIGTIARDGKIKDVRTAEASVNSSEGKTPLIDAAIRSMKAWRFDIGEHDDSFRVTFSYVIDTSRPHGSATIVEWDLPNRVTVTASRGE